MKYKELGTDIKNQFILFAAVFITVGILANYRYREVYQITTEQKILNTDSEGYYQYLPHFFIMKWDRMDKMRWAKFYEEGKSLNVYTCGVAIMQSPFFLAAHAISYFFELDHSGYTPVYYLFIFFASMFYVLCGLFFIYRFLQRFFTHKAALWSVILIFFASNLFYYTVMEYGMSHAYSFGLIALFIYHVPLFYENPCFRNLLKMALILGLATLIRPTNLIISLFLFLYGINSFGDLMKRIRFWRTRWFYLLVMLVVGILVFSPQMMYWHTVTGKYLFYSYREEGTFPNIFSPDVSTVLFGARNGWFVYSPIMFVATLGLLFLVYRRILHAWIILLIMVLIVYINGSWWVPTFSAAAGYRALIEFIPFMALPLAFVLGKAWKSGHPVIKGMLILLGIFFVYYNLQFSFKYSSWQWWDTEWQWNYLFGVLKF